MCLYFRCSIARTTMLLNMLANKHWYLVSITISFALVHLTLCRKWGVILLPQSGRHQAHNRSWLWDLSDGIQPEQHQPVLLRGAELHLLRGDSSSPPRKPMNANRQAWINWSSQKGFQVRFVHWSEQLESSHALLHLYIQASTRIHGSGHAPCTHYCSTEAYC